MSERSILVCDGCGKEQDSPPTAQLPTGWRWFCFSSALAQPISTMHACSLECARKAVGERLAQLFDDRKVVP